MNSTPNFSGEDLSSRETVRTATSRMDHPPGLKTIAEREAALLAPWAFPSSATKGRRHSEPVHPYRGPFQRDRDRVLHSAGFRRLSGKMQVFTGDMGDYHRTRLTHTVEVASIARTLGRALGLNEDLIEALALLHDIGHPPFGHAGEDAIHAYLLGDGGFSHNQYALTLVEELEERYATFPGLNLSKEVLASQTTRVDKSTVGRPPILEAQLVDASDSVTYNSHDVDDAVKLGLIEFDALLDLPLVQKAAGRVEQGLSPKRRRAAVVYQLIRMQVDSVLNTTMDQIKSAAWTDWTQPLDANFRIDLDPEMAKEKAELQSFLYDKVYRHPQIVKVRKRAQDQIHEMLDFFKTNPTKMPERFQVRAESVGIVRSAADYIAGMTDRYCQQRYSELIGE